MTFIKTTAATAIIALTLTAATTAQVGSATRTTSTAHQTPANNATPSAIHSADRFLTSTHITTIPDGKPVIREQSRSRPLVITRHGTILNPHGVAVFRDHAREYRNLRAQGRLITQGNIILRAPRNQGTVRFTNQGRVRFPKNSIIANETFVIRDNVIFRTNGSAIEFKSRAIGPREVAREVRVPREAGVPRTRHARPRHR